MGEAARRAFWRRGTPEQQFDAGVKFQFEILERTIEKIPVPPDGTVEEKALIRFKALRKASGK